MAGPGSWVHGLGPWAGPTSCVTDFEAVGVYAQLGPQAGPTKRITDLGGRDPHTADLSLREGDELMPPYHHYPR